MKFVRIILGTVKGIYDILATYLLLFIVPFAAAAFCLHLSITVVAQFFDYRTAQDMWDALSRIVGVNDIYLRIATLLPAHFVLYLGLRRPRRAIQPYVERAFDRVVRVFHKISEYFPSVRTFGELGFSLVVTALLIPFILQPTLVSGMATQSWMERTANLLDGTASAELVDSVFGLYRKIYAVPVLAQGVDQSDVDRAIEQIERAEQSEATAPPTPRGREPLMDRWNPYIAAVAEADPDQFAYIKAFMWVESAGRQFAVSHTGCAGLMQFCGGTAKSAPYRAVFGRGQVYNCGCRTKDCRVPRDVQRDLESGDPESIKRQKARFPCELTDARFDPKKAITAGGLYVARLRKAYGGNIYLMYIGYNSGPAIASSVWRSVGRNPAATIEEIDVFLPAALAPHYGVGANRRAKSLVRTHLPKIKLAFDRYREGGVPGDVVETPYDAAPASSGAPARSAKPAKPVARPRLPARPARPAKTPPKRAPSKAPVPEKPAPTASEKPASDAAPMEAGIELPAPSEPSGVETVTESPSDPASDDAVPQKAAADDPVASDKPASSDPPASETTASTSSDPPTLEQTKLPPADPASKDTSPSDPRASEKSAPDTPSDSPRAEKTGPEKTKRETGPEKTKPADQPRAEKTAASATSDQPEKSTPADDASPPL